eukprot:g6145.t1
MSEGEGPPSKRQRGADVCDGLDSYDAIVNLIHKFMHALDSGDGGAFAALFAPGAAVEICKLGKTVRGSDELGALCIGLHSKFARCQHWEGNVVVEVSADGESASNRSYWKALEGDAVVSLGRHEDTFQREGGRWLFTHRRVVHTWTKGGGFEGAGAAEAS